VSKTRCERRRLLVAAALAAFLTGCYPHNEAPDTPSPPIGPSYAPANYAAAYRSVSTDPDGDAIYLGFDWGDSGYYWPGDTTWSDATASGDTCQVVTHSWYQARVYSVRVVALDVHGLRSAWSEPLLVTVGSAAR
jgi:hypothetical protein